MFKKLFSYKITFLLFLTYLILFNFLIPKAYADCIVDTVQFDIGGRAGSGVTAVDHGNPITLSEIKQWDTSGDDISTCDVSHLNSLDTAFLNSNASIKTFLVGIQAVSLLWIACLEVLVLLIKILAIGTQAVSLI